MRYQDTRVLLAQLAETLQTAGLWQQSPPDPALLESSAPFCCDTLAFEQWLQFVFIARMQALIDARLPLPGNIALAPMAEMMWSAHPHYVQLHAMLSAIDAFFGGEHA